MKVLLDTNILIYADNAQYVLSDLCQSIIEESEGKYQICIAQRSLLEYYRVCTSKAVNSKIDEVLNNIEYYSDKFEIIYDDEQTTIAMFELAFDHNAKSGKIFDLNILALAISNSIDILITSNVKDFPKFKNLRILTPEEFNKLI
jgi:predicted nucleic acid-binding protein